LKDEDDLCEWARLLGWTKRLDEQRPPPSLFTFIHFIAAAYSDTGLMPDCARHLTSD
jgi:hypothetical protein